MDSKSKKGFLFILLTTVFIAIGQLVFNLASQIFEFSFSGILLNRYMWLGFIIYSGGLITLILGLKDGELTTLYPLLSLSYIWVLILSVLIFNETIPVLKAGGTLFIILGVIIITRSQDSSTVKKRVRQNG